MNERDKHKKLTRWQKRSLIPLKDEYSAKGNKITESRTLISQEACLRLGNSLISRNWQLTGAREDHPITMATESTKRLLDWFSENDKSTGTRAIIDELDNWLDKAFPKKKLQNYKASHNAVTIGFCFALEAFKFQYEPDFIDKLRKVNPQEIIDVFIAQPTQIENGTSLIEIARRRINIPKHQAFFKELVEEFSDNYLGNLAPQFENGAILAHNVIDELWSKLKLGAYKDRDVIES